MNKKLLSLLSLAARAGKLQSGEVACEKSLQAKSAYLVLVSADASENTKKKFINKSFFYQVPAYVLGSKVEIGQAIGKESRASVVVTDTNFAQMMIQLIEVEV